MQTQQLAHKRSEKPPKLPPRDNVYPHDIPKVRSDRDMIFIICNQYTFIN